MVTRVCRDFNHWSNMTRHQRHQEHLSHLQNETEDLEITLNEAEILTTDQLTKIKALELEIKSMRSEWSNATNEVTLVSYDWKA